MKKAAIFLGLALCCGCSQDRTFEVRKAYLEQLQSPATEAKYYLSRYTTDKVRCESGEHLFCTEARVDLAHIESAWQQALQIWDHMSADSGLSQADRNDATQELLKARRAIYHIHSAKSGTLPVL
jgi:hypothetical protein